MKGRSAIITGAGRGLGKVVAKSFWNWVPGLRSGIGMQRPHARRQKSFLILVPRIGAMLILLLPMP